MTEALTPTPRLVRFKQACEQLDITTDTGYTALRNGTFPVPVVQVGGLLKVRTADLERFLSGADA
jgi:predicted DNA-binding transcriptional regulator AlpA